jgi:DNA polymerase-3 subunit beta
MKIVADRQALYGAMQHVGSVIASTAVSPIFQNVKMEAEKDEVFLSATDMEVGLRVRVGGVEVKEAGSVLIPEGRISPILRATLDETVTIEGDENAVVLKASDGRFRVVAENPADFVDIPSLTGGDAVEVDADVLTYMVRRTAFATADEGGRYALNGVLVIVDKNGTFEMVAADGARLANVKKKAGNPQKTAIDCIVMKKGIEQAARLAGLSDNPLHMQATERQFLVENDAGRLCCQLIEGQFPNYREVIPRDCKIKVELPVRPLLNALQRAALLTSEQTRAVDFIFTKGLLTLSTEAPDLGEAEVRVKIDYDGPGAKTAFNPDYIEDMLQVVERESVKMEFDGPRSPAVFRSGVDYHYVVSPVVRGDSE